MTKLIQSIPTFPGASVVVERRGDTYVVERRMGTFGNYESGQFNNPDDALHAAKELASQKSKDMRGLYDALGGLNADKE